MENLKQLVYNGDVTQYQRSLAQRELEGLIKRLEIYENKTKSEKINNSSCWYGIDYDESHRCQKCGLYHY